jgi:hypothetical protein
LKEIDCSEYEKVAYSDADNGFGMNPEGKNDYGLNCDGDYKFLCNFDLNRDQ